MTNTDKRSSTANGADHRAACEYWLRIIAAGRASCPQCGRRIDPADAWDFGRSPDRSGYRGPEHAACDRARRAPRQTRGGQG